MSVVKPKPKAKVISLIESQQEQNTNWTNQKSKQMEVNAGKHKRPRLG